MVYDYFQSLNKPRSTFRIATGHALMEKERDKLTALQFAELFRFAKNHLKGLRIRASNASGSKRKVRRGGGMKNWVLGWKQTAEIRKKGQ